MKLLPALIAASAMFTATTAFAADVTGLWATETDNGRVQVYKCGDALCGKLIDADQIRTNPEQTDYYNKNKAQRGRKVKGLVLFAGYRGGPDEWKGGLIYDPKTGDTGRSGKIRLTGPNALEVKGCLGPICRTQHWKRAG